MLRQGLCFALVCRFLVGCTSIPLSSIPKLSALKPETMALDRVQLAVRVQEDFQLYQDGARIGLEATGPLIAEPMALDLQMVPSEEELTPFLTRQEKRGYRIAMFEVDPEDAETIESFRTEMLAIKEGSSGEGRHNTSISAGASGCLAEGANPFQDLRMKLYIRTSESEEFFTLFKEQRLSLNRTSDGNVGIGVCDEEDAPRLLWTQ